MFRKAKQIAQKKSNHAAHRMGAVVVKGNRILSTGANQVSRGCKYIHDKKWSDSLHAEAAAILQLLKHNDLRSLAGADLYVTRINKVGHVRMAKPCRYCQDLAQAVGIRRIFYTTNEGTTECFRVA